MMAMIIKWHKCDNLNKSSFSDEGKYISAELE